MKNSKLKKALKSQAEEMEIKASIAESKVRIQNALSQIDETYFDNMKDSEDEDESMPDSQLSEGPAGMCEAPSANYYSTQDSSLYNGTILTTAESVTIGSRFTEPSPDMYMEAPQEAIGQEAIGTKPREIRIVPLNRGYNVVVGCHTFAFEDHSRMMKYITKYYENPSATEQEWFSNKLF